MTSGSATVTLFLILIGSALLSLPSVATPSLSAPRVLAAQGGPPLALPNGTAARLAVYPTPATLLPQANAAGEVFVQLQDASGNPAAAPRPINVTIASSRPDIVNVTRSMTIQQGSTYGTAFSSASYQPGVTTITASSTGLATGFAQLTVVGPKPSKLSVVVTPGIVAAQSGDLALIAVQLQGADGTPAPAPAPVVVVVTSSNTVVGTVTTSTFAIPLGKSFGTTGFQAGSPGNTTITAIAQGYVSGTFSLLVKTPVRNNMGFLSLYLGTPSILNDRSQYPTIAVQLQQIASGTSGVPMVATSNVTVYFSSSNTPAGTVPIGSIPGYVVIQAGHSFAPTTITSTLAVGSTVITAAASNFLSDFQPITSAGPAPYRLAVILGLRQIVADGGTYSTTAVQLQDASGNPAKAPVDIVVTLASSSPSVGNVDQALVIPSGKSHAFLNFLSTAVAGASEITASASGYLSGQGTMAATYLPMSGVIAPSVQSPPALTNVKIALNITSGVSPLGGADVLWSFNSKQVSLVNETRTTDAAGNAYTYVFLHDSGNLTLGAAVQKAGFGQLNLTLKLVVKPQPLTIQLIPTNTILNASQSTTIRAQVSSRGKPLANAALAWSTDLGTVAPPTSNTDNAGSATVTFLSPTNGTANVKASVTLAGYGAITQSTQITVNLAGGSTGGGGTGGGGGGIGVSLFSGNLIYIVVVLVVVLVLFLVVRRRRRKGKAAAKAKGEAEETAPQEESEA